MLQDAIQTLSSTYLKHTNAVLGKHSTGLDVSSVLIGDNPILGGLGGLCTASPAKSMGSGNAKEKKKKHAHDLNVSKWPLTPYFLYMQTMQPIIAEDLGPDMAKGTVSTKGVQH